MGLKALVIDDSVVFQKIMAEVLKGISGVDSVVVAATAQAGLAEVAAGKPDVVFLDLHLPDLDGMEVLVKIKQQLPSARVVIVSGLAVEGADLTVKALSRGAQQFVSKPTGTGFKESIIALQAELQPVVKTVLLQMGLANRNKPAPVRASNPVVAASGNVASMPAAAPKPNRTPMGAQGSYWVVGLAVSTGGPEALSHVIPKLPANFPLPIVMVQHMPPLFTQSLAKSLNAKSQVTVVEGKAGDVLYPGQVYIAPGGKHLVVREVDGRPVLATNEEPPEQSVRPSADVLFRSLSDYPERKSVLSVVMTGMGEDGLAGSKLLAGSGTYCLTQSEETCVVYGMPRAVDAANLSHENVDLDNLADRMVALTAGSRATVPS